MGFSGIWILLITAQLMHAVAAQEMLKRAPQGFLGMRGKKYYDDPETVLYKRKPHFFVAVKGKKTFDLPYEQGIGYKRAPMGFMGMRGKKEYPENLLYPDIEYVPKSKGSLIGQIEYSSDEFNQDQSAFPILSQFLDEYIQKMQRSNTEEQVHEEIDPDSRERILNEVDKRAAHMNQFYGVRGKKSIQSKRPYDLSFRGKFIGVRGKKDLKNSGAQEIKILLDHNAKRKGQMGFFGMRGKKWTDEPSSEAEIPN